MEENTGTRSNRTVVIALAVIAVLLVGVIVVMALGNKGADTTTDNGATGGGSAAATDTPVAVGDATKLPAGMTPEQAVRAYFDAVVAGDYQAAYDLLPAEKKASYGSADAFGSQVKAYGMTGYTIDDVTAAGSETKITATAAMPGGSFGYVWTFTKDGSDWIVKSRELSGMGG